MNLFDKFASFFSPYVLAPFYFCQFTYPCPKKSVFVFFLVISSCFTIFFLYFSLSSRYFLPSTISCHFPVLSCHSLSCLIPLLSCPALVMVLYLVPVLTSILFLPLPLSLPFSCTRFSWNNFFISISILLFSS
jgi:hypothetical protein